jgi:hypothetical protein
LFDGTVDPRDAHGTDVRGGVARLELEEPAQSRGHAPQERLREIGMVVQQIAQGSAR